MTVSGGVQKSASPVKMTWKKWLLLLVFMEINIYTGIVLWLSYLGRTVPQELTLSFFTAFTVEFVAMAKLTIEEGKQSGVHADGEDDGTQCVIDGDQRVSH